MWNPFAKPKRTQSAVFVTEHKHLVPGAEPVEKGYCVNDKSREAWQIGDGTLLRKRGTDVWSLFLFERNAAPLIFNGTVSTNRKSLKDTAESVAREAMYRELYDIAAKNKKNWMAEAVVIMALVFGCITAMTIVYTLFASGRVSISLPF